MAVGVEGSPSKMAEQFELQTLLNAKVKNTVGHISMSFSAEDAARLATDDKLMLKIAYGYMKLMDIENTQFIIVRYIDRNHPHCHNVMYEYKSNYNDLISDFNLYLCERFGYRNACSVMWNENGICISIHKGSLDIYIRF